MPISSFIGYVGPSDFHDGSILSVEQGESIARVRISGANGSEFLIECRGVHAVRARNPVGMLLYAVSEMRLEPPLRRFAFANFNADDTAFLEIDAETFMVVETDVGGTAA